MYNLYNFLENYQKKASIVFLNHFSFTTLLRGGKETQRKFEI